MRRFCGSRRRPPLRLGAPESPRYPGLSRAESSRAWPLPVISIWQLQVYADAGRREGLDVRAAYVHELNSGQRRPVDIGTAALQGAETKVISLVERLKARQFAPSPGRVCRECDVKALCKHGGAGKQRSARRRCPGAQPPVGREGGRIRPPVRSRRNAYKGSTWTERSRCAVWPR